MPQYGPVDASTALRSSTTPITATTTDTALALKAAAQEAFSALFDISAQSGGATVALEVQASIDQAFTTPISLGTVTVPQANQTGQFYIPLDGPSIIDRVAPGAATPIFVRSKVTVTGGTSPSTTYTAWLVPAFRS
ncbi:MAG: hypothetical protein U1E62_21445 [Alsobacter sp.]